MLEVYLLELLYFGEGEWSGGGVIGLDPAKRGSHYDTRTGQGLLRAGFDKWIVDWAASR